jgi:hypothetical protein
LFKPFLVKLENKRKGNREITDWFKMNWYSTGKGLTSTKHYFYICEADGNFTTNGR